MIKIKLWAWFEQMIYEVNQYGKQFFENKQFNVP